MTLRNSPVSDKLQVRLDFTCWRYWNCCMPYRNLNVDSFKEHKLFTAFSTPKNLKRITLNRWLN